MMGVYLEKIVEKLIKKEKLLKNIFNKKIRKKEIRENK